MLTDSKTPLRKSPALALLGGISAAEFLRDYWQKKPLLIRGALPGFGTDLDRAGLLDLAAREDVESRFVAHDNTQWQLACGPFRKTAMRRWQGKWTVLVQGVNLVLPAGDNLLRQFSFIPHARLDDLMVSYATDGGGVGPHIDNYDVFLIQGQGKRRWRVGKQVDQRLVEGAPLKILRHFKPEFDWVLEPGDMLYLPPDWAHDGTAVGDCMTWSVGFRTSPTQELAEQFLGFLQDHLAQEDALTGRYADPDLVEQQHPGEISPAMIGKVANLLQAVRWDDALVRDFLGTTLTEPKPHVFFDAPESSLTLAKFAKAARSSGVWLDARSRMLFAGDQFYLNGEQWSPPKVLQARLRILADTRKFDAATLANDPEPTLMELLHQWHACGFLHLN